MWVNVLLNYWITCENIVAIQTVKKINNRLNNIGRKKNSVFLQSVQNGEQKEEERKEAER